jgi:hypothetical protein
MVSRHVGPQLVKQDVVNFLSETIIRQWLVFDISGVATGLCPIRVLTLKHLDERHRFWCPYFVSI